MKDLQTELKKITTSVQELYQQNKDLGKDIGKLYADKDSLEFMIDAKKTQYTIDHELLSARHNFGNEQHG